MASKTAARADPKYDSHLTNSGEGPQTLSRKPVTPPIATQQAAWRRPSKIEGGHFETPSNEECVGCEAGPPVDSTHLQLTRAQGECWKKRRRRGGARGEWKVREVID